MKCNSQTLRLRRERILRLAIKKLGTEEAARAWLLPHETELDTTEGFTRVLDLLEDSAP